MTDSFVALTYEDGDGTLTALDHIDLTVAPGAKKTAELDLLDQLGIGRKADRRPHQLSGGERQRVGIASAPSPPAEWSDSRVAVPA